MQGYLDLMKEILEDGYEEINERTGTGTLKLIARQLRFDLKKSFPLVTTKKIHMKSVIHELLWMIRGETNIRYLVLNGVRIWNEWPFQRYLEANGLAEELPKGSPEWQEALEEFIGKIKQNHDFGLEWGDLGPVYGKQWRDFDGVDQLNWVEEEIKRNPANRRLIVSSWNPPSLAEMALPPCPMLYQFFVTGKELRCQVYIRSWDVFLGGPFNIAAYALLTLMMAQATNLEATELIIASGDTHLYLNHLDLAREQLTREPRALPKMTLNPDVTSLFGFAPEDFTLDGYDPHPHIKAEVSV